MRSPDTVMKLKRLGAMFPTRLSFSPTLIRRMARENWQFDEPEFHTNAKGVGHALVKVHTGQRSYTLIAFCNDLAPEQRSDRVIATAWDATFTLFDGHPSDQDIQYLSSQVPHQEAGRCRQSELALSRANKSVRLFDHVIKSLAAGHQPDANRTKQVGYLMRTTAVYGNGKFGIADRQVFADRPEFKSSFMVEMLTVYLIRLFSFGWVEHMARLQAPATAVKLDQNTKQSLGIGNSTGLGMAPFLISHPQLIHTWFAARETAFEAALQSPVSNQDWKSFKGFFAQVLAHIAEWQVADQRYTARISQLKNELADLTALCERQVSAWTELTDWSLDKSLDCQELVVSLLIEAQAELVESLASSFETPAMPARPNPAMPVANLRKLIDQSYAWTRDFDFDQAAEQARFWYVAEEKLEPRFGHRWEEPGGEFETPIAIARDVDLLEQALGTCTDDANCAEFLRQHPEHRQIIARIQQASAYAYGEVRDNLVSQECLPIDLLRAKLAMFGASKFDPKSDLWTRITLYQGAPLPHQLSNRGFEPWYLSALAA